MASQDTTPAPSGLKAQLHHLLPRHALFHVRICIHQLASVPLVHGEFGVRWKFKNTHKLKEKGKAKPEHEGDGDSFGSAEEGQTLPVPSISQSASSSSVGEPYTPAHSRHASSRTLPFRRSRSRIRTDDSHVSQTPSSSNSLSHSSADEPLEITSARGQTPWYPLRDHSVTWDHLLSVVVQMSIDRDTHHLLPHPFKLTVLQRVIQGDPNAPRNPRLGSVHLDLAEYADSFPSSTPSKGVVMRRYLLRDSKTNATLRLSVRVEPAGTPPSFVAPPLPRGEILAGVATLLSTHGEVYRTRPSALDLYAPPAEDDANQSRNPTTTESPPRAKPAFDIHALPRAYGPRPTASLIEAIFNPAPVRDARLVGPFTRLVPDGSPYSPAAYPSSSFTSSSSSASIRSASASSSASVHSASAGALSALASLSPASADTTDGRAPPSRWWQRSKSRSRSRSRVRARAPPVAVA
ncbi:N-terminal C2 in EEIG1 and EHBP1 proteins-domain-containing protein [Mycena pura]|uniref:N-terminal C2 in EEIG1 and EHBP1 proteins-domain-containing protein n=1 Tax=Mycena pura TaxID=153505 RepID=A0AAD6VAM8_9AGAR|nr:N-terminal C2 in EEIG1 and EHBP1 proteins-domain-containing protein [Mycena pura]